MNMSNRTRFLLGVSTGLVTASIIQTGLHILAANRVTESAWSAPVCTGGDPTRNVCIRVKATSVPICEEDDWSVPCQLIRQMHTAQKRYTERWTQATP